MLSQILRIPSGYIDSVNDPVIGMAATPGGTGLSKFSGQLGMEVELRQDMMKLKTPSVPVAAGKFQYVRLAAGSTVPAVGSTVNWDATVDRRLYQVTATAGTAAGTVLTPNLTPGNYTIIQTVVSVPTGTLSALMADEGDELRVFAEAAAQAAIAKAKADGKTDKEAAEDGRRAAKAVEAKAKAEAEDIVDAADPTDPLRKPKDTDPLRKPKDPDPSPHRGPGTKTT